MCRLAYIAGNVPFVCRIATSSGRILLAAPANSLNPAGPFLQLFLEIFLELFVRIAVCSDWSKGYRRER
jgi:hypothetical protein